MGTVLSTASARRIDERGAPALISLLASAVVVVAWTVLQPHTADLAAQFYRTGLFDRAGWILWDNNWFGGHQLPGYSLLTPWLMAEAGIGVTGAIAAATTTAAFAAIARTLRPGAAMWPTAWVAWAAAGDLLIGRVTYSVGLAFAVLAVLALVRGQHTLLACVLGAVSAAASPVAGLFLGMAIAVWWSVQRRDAMLAVAACAGTVTVGSSLLFGDGGAQPYSTAAAAIAIAIAFALRLCLARDAVLARRALLAYALAAGASWLLPTPMGSNISRLGVAFAVPIALMARRRLTGYHLAAVAIAAAAWLVFAPATEIAKSLDAPETRPAYYAPLLTQLQSRQQTPGRVEVVPSATRWESAYVAERYPLARGWESQLDRKRNGLFYGPHLRAASYLRWLRFNAVRFVALSRAPKERWGRAEEQLVRGGAAGLRLVWASRAWRLYAVDAPRPLASGARVTRLGVNEITMRAASPGTVVLRVRWSRYWNGGAGVGIARRRDGFMDVTVRDPGCVVLRASPGRPPRSPGC
ncbi:MAG: hypothetical protein QOE11_1641 [Solirubrobacteraceae bacterium]|nr:hypothetical protein [Solirubrobacteraceae bacterium]